jgi:hypothetical protein
VAVHGTRRYARHVGRAAATLNGFPHAARVLAHGGTVATAWRGPGGEGPESCRLWLEREGVAFVAGRADPARKVGWETLIARADALGLARAATIAPF